MTTFTPACASFGSSAINVLACASFCTIRCAPRQVGFARLQFLTQAASALDLDWSFSVWQPKTTSHKAEQRNPRFIVKESHVRAADSIHFGLPEGDRRNVPLF